jgi:DNA/RNA-binding domain of Phe-tRNA-synthetase-like protein
LIVEPSFWQLFPDALIGVVLAEGVDSTRNRGACAAMLGSQIARTAAELGEGEIGSHPAVAAWRAAYAAFGVKPSKYRSSIESLLRSAKAGRLRSISPLVDSYNTVSLRHLLPAGGEDLETIQGDLRLTRAAGDEHFVPIGGSEPEPPPAGAVIYRDDAGVVCSCWNWRESDRTKLTDRTTRAVLVIEALPPTPRSSLENALTDLSGLVQGQLGGRTRVAVADRGVPQLSLEV